MRISTKGRHAVMAMVDLARNSHGRPVSLADIADRLEISLSYMEQLVARLKAHRLVTSLRGPGGGYMLDRPSDRITISEIISAVDDPTTRHSIADPMTANSRQVTDLLWQTVGDEVHRYLGTVTLASVNNCGHCTNLDRALSAVA